MKNARHTAILDLIGKEDISTQEEMAEKLKAHGMSVTQATVSRDIKELRLIKVLTSVGLYKYATAEEKEQNISSRFVRIFINSVVSVQSANNIIVIKTLPGSASGAGEAIDNMRWPEILGTLSGDNTLMVVIRSEKETQDVIARFRKMLE